ncbi:transposable element Tcb2 transposase [Trichonephila clavipes]|nr:transposable element Tcb2 transposase [Trichonephila clavipes]
MQITENHQMPRIVRHNDESTARGGRVRSTTPAEDRYIVLSAKRNRRTTAQQVANQFLAASGKQISRKTVARRLRGGGLYARRPVVCVPLTRQHRTARLQWCREHHNWTEQDWACVLFSDESRFSLSSDCRRQLIWRESGTAYRPENIQEKDRYPTCSIMVWAGIMINGRTRLHVVANGTMTGQRYIDEVLLPHVRLFRGAVGDKFVFMDDSATYHRTLAVQDCLDSEGIQRLAWPARSPHLNPIENVWDALGRQVAGRNYPPTNKNTLIRALTEEWDKLPQQLLDNVVQSMVRRVECCITLHGGHIPFSLQSDSHRTLIWRAPGTRYHQENTIERHRYGGAGWLVWGGIILRSRTDLHVQSVMMTSHIYRDVILEQHVHECLQSEDITRTYWPAYSPDLNRIEHVWDILGRRIAARQPRPTCLPELRKAVLDEWCNIPQDQIDNLILSMPRRCLFCSGAWPQDILNLKFENNEQESLHQVHLTFPHNNHTPGLDLQTTVSEKCPSSLEGEQKKQRKSRDSDEAHFWLNGYVNKQNCRIWSEANPQVYVETPLHPEKLTVWCALWAGGILLQKR